ncbi:MFS transporter [Chloroflexota bacterium]
MIPADNSPSELGKPKFFYGYVVVGISFLISMTIYGAMYTFTVFLEPLLAEFGWSRAATSGAFSLFMVFHGLLYIATGRLTDRFGPRIVITICSIFLGLGYILMSLIDTIWQLYLVYGVIISIGVSGAFIPLASTIARWFILKRGVMTGILTAGVGVGTMLLPRLASWLIEGYGWRNSYVIIGGLLLVVILLAAQFLRRDPYQMGLLPDGRNESGAGTENNEATGYWLSAALRTRQFWLLCVVWAGFLYSIMATMVHIVIYATGLGFSPGNAANVMVIIGGFSVIGRLALGYLADRMGIRPSMMVCLIALSILLFWLVFTRDMWSVYLFAVVFGFAYGGLVTLASPLVAELFGLRSHGVLLGIITFVGTIGGAIGPVMSGYIFDIRESYQLAFLVSAIVAAMAAVLALLLRPTTGEQGQTNSS